MRKQILTAVASVVALGMMSTASLAADEVLSRVVPVESKAANAKLMLEPNEVPSIIVRGQLDDRVLLNSDDRARLAGVMMNPSICKSKICRDPRFGGFVVSNTIPIVDSQGNPRGGVRVIGGRSGIERNILFAYPTVGMKKPMNIADREAALDGMVEALKEKKSAEYLKKISDNARAKDIDLIQVKARDFKATKK